MAEILHMASTLMATVLIFVASAILWMAPAYFANMAPVLASKFNWFPSLATPVSKVWFGVNKTWRGLLAGYLFALGCVFALLGVDLIRLMPSASVDALAASSLLGWVLGHALKLIRFIPDMYIDYASIPIYFLPLTALQFAVGALGGDMVKSYFKRHWARIPPGKPWNPWDRIDFVLGTIVMTIPLFVEWFPYPPKLTLLGQTVLFVIVATFFLQWAVNIVAYRIGWKKDI